MAIHETPEARAKRATAILKVLKKAYPKANFGTYMAVVCDWLAGYRAAQREQRRAKRD
jgi:hypothetical protein